MRLNLNLAGAEKIISSGGILPLSIPSMPEKIEPQPLNRSEQKSRIKRELAWQIAPNLLISFKYAWAGVYYTFVTQRNFRIHTCVAIVVITLGIFLHLNPAEMGVLGLTIALVMTLELLNTAIESVVDLTVGQKYHELAKVAKDCAAGAVLIAAIAAVFVGGWLLIPPMVTLIF
ncbi:diacylglycerol kinase family protein [Oscillatoria salina]|uniref:diacylglycerol kinase family protein n=1 Tax=Oscillatoria salina TaxID=331517 RepID=UPI002961F06B|nr:diacylglycerol kinase family protein [Oscillatoria salina]